MKIGIAMAALLATVLHSDAPPRASDTSFRFTDERIYVPVTVAGVVRWFILDTGAQPTLLDVGTARAGHIPWTQAGSTTGAGGGRTAVGEAQPVLMHVGSVALGPMATRVAPLDSLLGPSSGQRVGGIVGSRFFREHVVELDFASLSMHVSDPSSYVYRGTGVVIPLELENDVPSARGWMTVPGGERIPMRFLVDLGAKATLLVSEPFVRAHDLMSRFTPAVVGALGAGMGGPTHYAFVRVPQLEVGSSPVTQLRSFVAGLSVRGTLTNTSYDGLLGAEYLARFHVIFDYARRRLILEPRTPPPPVGEFDMSGMFLVAEDSLRTRFEIRELRPGSPAESAGLRPGDVITTIDGRPSRTLTLAAVRDILRRRDRQPISIAVARDSETVRVVLVLQRAV